jgi:hypothetical protein
MAERGLGEDDVRAVLATGERLFLDPHGNRVVAGVVRGRLVFVVVAAGSAPPRVITVVERGGV